MLKRLIALLGVLAAMAGTAATPAFAANPTCDTHTVGAPIIDPNTNQIGTSWNFQCGGAIGSPGADFIVDTYLYHRTIGTTNWLLTNCGTGGGACYYRRPSGTTNCGSYYCAGTLHGDSHVFNQTDYANGCSGNIQWMQGVIIYFRNYPSIVYDSPVVSC